MSIYSDIGLTTSSSTSSTSSASNVVKKQGQILYHKLTLMKLLTTQLSYQDPTKPVDNVEMVSNGANFIVIRYYVIEYNVNTMSSSMTSSQSFDGL